MHTILTRNLDILALFVQQNVVQLQIAARTEREREIENVGWWR